MRLPVSNLTCRWNLVILTTYLFRKIRLARVVLAAQAKKHPIKGVSGEIQGRFCRYRIEERPRLLPRKWLILIPIGAQKTPLRFLPAKPWKGFRGEMGLSKPLLGEGGTNNDF